MFSSAFFRHFVGSIALVTIATSLTVPVKVVAQNITLTPVEGNKNTDVCREFQIAQAVFEAILEAEGTPIEATIRAGDDRVGAAADVQEAIADEDVNEDKRSYHRVLKN